MNTIEMINVTAVFDLENFCVFSVERLLANHANFLFHLMLLYFKKHIVQQLFSDFLFKLFLFTESAFGFVRFGQFILYLFLSFVSDQIFVLASIFIIKKSNLLEVRLKLIGSGFDSCLLSGLLAIGHIVVLR